MSTMKAGPGVGGRGPMTPGDNDRSVVSLDRASWGAVFAGVAIALAVQVILTLVGTGIGVATLDPGAGGADNPAVSSFSIGAGAWYVLSALVAAYVGGYVAARMSGRGDRVSAGLHGITTWAVTTLLVLYLLTTTVGSIVGGAFSGVASTLGGIGQTVAQTAAPALANSNPLDAIEEQVRSTGTSPEALQGNAINAIRALLTDGDAGAEQARVQAAQALSTARGIPVDQATTQISQIEQQYRSAVDTAKQTATRAAKITASVVSKGSLIAALALLLGAAAGWFGGRSGALGPRRH